MFEQFIRELKRHPLNEGVMVPIDLPLDEKGYFDRICPGRECGAPFKVLFVDWRDKVPDSEAFCPKCGKRDTPTAFNTTWQRRYIADVGKAYVTEQLGQAFSRAARRTRPRRMSTGLFSLEMSVSYRPGLRKVILPPAAEEKLRQDFTCDPCGCRYSTVGAAHFCPACGLNCPLQDFERTVATSLKTVESLDAISQAVSEKHDQDIAADIEQQILEDQIENLVSAFQRATESLFQQLPNANDYRWDQNLFQRVADSSELWQRATGRGYDAILGPTELAQLEKMIQRRHKIGHAQGMVDERYLAKTGDYEYSQGQKLVISRSDVEHLAAIIKRLVTSLRESHS